MRYQTDSGRPEYMHYAHRQVWCPVQGCAPSPCPSVRQARSKEERKKRYEQKLCYSLVASFLVPGSYTCWTLNGENSAAPWHKRNSRDIGARLTTSEITPRVAWAVKRLNS